VFQASFVIQVWGRINVRNLNQSTASVSEAYPKPPSLQEGRLEIKRLVNLSAPSDAETNVGSDVIQGLTQTPKTLPPKYFYDDRGSVLFEQICELPEYYPTRTETVILRQYAGEIAS
jgi:L-histidine N-alpha-methyltransferase